MTLQLNNVMQPDCEAPVQFMFTLPRDFLQVLHINIRGRANIIKPGTLLNNFRLATPTDLKEAKKMSFFIKDILGDTINEQRPVTSQSKESTAKNQHEHKKTKKINQG